LRISPRGFTCLATDTAGGQQLPYQQYDFSVQYTAVYDPGKKKVAPPGVIIQTQIYMLQLTTDMHTLPLLQSAYLPEEDEDCRQEDAALPDSTP